VTLTFHSLHCDDDRTPGQPKEQESDNRIGFPSHIQTEMDVGHLNWCHHWLYALCLTIALIQYSNSNIQNYNSYFNFFSDKINNNKIYDIFKNWIIQIVKYNSKSQRWQQFKYRGSIVKSKMWNRSGTTMDHNAMSQLIYEAYFAQELSLMQRHLPPPDYTFFVWWNSLTFWHFVLFFKSRVYCSDLVEDLNSVMMSC
jgi:hypothetical protein